LSLSTKLLDALSPKNKIFVAFSGGLDSTALLFLCNKALKQKKINNLKAIHINHNLSKNSDNWQQHCESFCRSNNIEFESFMVEVSKNRSSIESQARQARYKIFESLLDENDQILFSLLFFNIGIEIGQLLLIPFISLFIYIAHNLNFYKHSVSFSSYAVGSMGAYWAISRFINLF